MTMKNSVGVVIPTFNSVETIERALNSVANQTLLPKCVVVVDNHSTDETVAKVRRFAANHPVLSLVTIELPKNLGPGYARNVGWDSCDTALIAFLDSDDSWHPLKLERMVEVSMSHPEHVLFGHSYALVNSTTEASALMPLGSGRVHYFSLRHFLIRNRLSTPTVLVRRTVSNRFPSDYWYAEDFYLWTLIVAQKHMAVYLDLALANLHKAPFGQSGLSADLKEMHCGELNVIRSLRRSGLIRAPFAQLVSLWLRLKYLRRRLLTVNHD